MRMNFSNYSSTFYLFFFSFTFHLNESSRKVSDNFQVSTGIRRKMICFDENLDSEKQKTKKNACLQNIIISFLIQSQTNF